MTTASPLSSSAFFTPILYSIQNASRDLSASTARLSSGNRIVNVGDDVASYSIASRLQSQITGLKQASSNAAQGTSLLQVASGGLSQISDVLSQLKTLSIQASSSAITDIDRAYLQAQFDSLLDSIDSIARSTTFNSVNLLDGTLSGGGLLTTETSNATQAVGTITIGSNPTGGQTYKINGATITATTDFTIGGSTSATAEALATYLNASTDTRLSVATYEAVGSNINITAKAGGTAGNKFYIDKANSTASASFTVSGNATNVTNVYTLSGGADDGLNISSVQATGSVSDTMVTSQSQTAASVTLTLSANVSAAETFKIGDGNGSDVTFTFVSGSPASSQQVQIGATVEETLQNVVKTLSQYSGSDNYGISQLNYRIQGNSLVLSNKTVGNVVGFNGSAVGITEQTSNGTLSGSSFNNGTTTGVDVSGVTNSAFKGTLEGFTATYNSADAVTASVTVGDSTYTATITDTTPGSDTTVRFSSDEGGYFDVKLAGTLGHTVSDQDTADTYAAHLNAAFAGLTFTQERSLSNFTPTGSLIGSKAKLRGTDFSDIRIESIEITPPANSGSDATIDITINGDVYRASSGLGGSIGAYETVTFTNISDNTKSLSFTNGATAQDFSTQDAADDFVTELDSAFNVGEGGSGTDFQVGNASTDKITVSLGSASVYSIFDGSTPNISTQDDAEAAQDAIDAAAANILEKISTVGGLQSSFSIVSANLSQSITNISAAHSALADTDIAAESTEFASATLRVNAGVAVLAQALALPSSLLNLIHAIGNS